MRERYQQYKAVSTDINGQISKIISIIDTRLRELQWIIWWTETNTKHTLRNRWKRITRIHRSGQNMKKYGTIISKTYLQVIFFQFSSKVCKTFKVICKPVYKARPQTKYSLGRVVKERSILVTIRNWTGHILRINHEIIEGNMEATAVLWRWRIELMDDLKPKKVSVQWRRGANGKGMCKAKSAATNQSTLV